MHLGSDDHLIPSGKILQGTSKDFFASSNGIDIGRIEEIDPQFKGFPNDRAAVFLIEHPFVNPTRCIPKTHAAEADTRNLHARGT
jgi:hypothetical protein